MRTVYLSVISKRSYRCPDLFVIVVHGIIAEMSQIINYVHKSVDMLLCIVRCRVIFCSVAVYYPTRHGEHAGMSLLLSCPSGIQ